MTDPTRILRAQDLELPPELVERVVPVVVAAGRQLEQVFRPYRLRLSPLPGGARAEGDDVAVSLAAKLFEALAEAPASRLIDEALVVETATLVVQTALRHDLAFRLPGLRHPLRPMSLSQVAFTNALLYSDRSLIIGVGPTGTGKTHLTVAAALTLLAQGQFRHIVITRPHVLLEGEVMTPALRAEIEPDGQVTATEHALRDLIGLEEIKRLTDEGVIEITPLGRMRGRTFNKSFIIIDEAQNMSVPKMRMAATRIGRDTRLVIIGDPDQVDLPRDEPSGLAHLLELLEGTDVALIHRFERRHIVRNTIVARLEELYAQQAKSGQRAAA